MSDLPFGFGGADRDPERPGEGQDPMGIFGMFSELQAMMGNAMNPSAGGGPVNWDLARQLAEQGLAGENPGLAPDDDEQVRSALSLADLWLDEVTDLPSGVRHAAAWTRSEWVDRTLPGWTQLCEPVAARVATAMTDVVPQEQLAIFGPGNPLAAIMNQVGGMMFGAQVGQGVAGLAKEVVSASDIGIPLAESGQAALVPANVAAFGEGLERPEDEVRLYLALREAAHQRLFVHVPWLRQRLLAAVEEYARGFTIDMSAIESAMSELNPNDPQAVQDALSGGLFEPRNTPEQEAALRRVETLLALVEGWVDTVVGAAAAERMPGAGALREASRRRRATGGPAEQTFATLVGLELRPRRLREAAALWWAVTEKHGVTARDHIWDHPDLLPSADDLDDPLGFAESLGTDPLAELSVDDFAPVVEEPEQPEQKAPAADADGSGIDAPAADASGEDHGTGEPPTDVDGDDAGSPDRSD